MELTEGMQVRFPAATLQEVAVVLRPRVLERLTLLVLLLNQERVSERVLRRQEVEQIPWDQPSRP
jgi:hypothetical protein